MILDCVGGDYLSKNIDCAAVDGRIILIAYMSNAWAKQINLAKILKKRLILKGSTLRSRSLAYKSDLIHSFNRHYKVALVTKELKPIIDQVLPWELVELAHQRMIQNLNKGKIILTIA